MMNQEHHLICFRPVIWAYGSAAYPWVSSSHNVSWSKARGSSRDVSLTTDKSQPWTIPQHQDHSLEYDKHSLWSKTYSSVLLKVNYTQSTTQCFSQHKTVINETKLSKNMMRCHRLNIKHQSLIHLWNLIYANRFISAPHLTYFITSAIKNLIHLH